MDMTGDALFEALVQAVAPVGFFADRRGEVLRVMGDISAFVAQGDEGVVGTRQLAPPLCDEIPGLVAAALESGRRRSACWNDVEGPGPDRVCGTCYPVPHRPGKVASMCLVAIEALPPMQDREAKIGARAHPVPGALHDSPDALRRRVEDLQATNEELQTVNRETLSTNAALQASNQELETSIEDLKSTNEELVSVNETLQAAAARMQDVQADLDAVLSNVPAVVLLVDPALNVRHASARARALLAIPGIPAAGLHLSRLSLPEGMPPLSRHAGEALARQETRRLRMGDATGIRRDLILIPYAGGRTGPGGLMITIAPDEPEGPLAPLPPAPGGPPSRAD